MALSWIAITGREISLPVVAAILTVVGYSINDTIVVFDRIREDRKIMRKISFGEIIDLSINQTLSRTILTSTTTLLVVLSLFLFGGPVINDFAFVLLIGVVFGTYSSVFIAAPLLYDWPSKKAAKKKR
jgi:preprotein translocase SecF subunit